jgi:hypothetical protein
MACAGLLIDGLALGEDGPIIAAMTLLGRDEADTAVAVRVVIAVHELLHPSAGLVEAGKATDGVIRTVLAGAEQRLGIRIIVAGAGSAIGSGNPEPIQRRQQRLAFHRAAVVGMQDKQLVDTALSQHRPTHHLSRIVGGLALVDLPADDLATVEIDDEVEVEKQPLEWPRQPTNIPRHAVDLRAKAIWLRSRA